MTFPYITSEKKLVFGFGREVIIHYAHLENEVRPLVLKFRQLLGNREDAYWDEYEFIGDNLTEWMKLLAKTLEKDVIVGAEK